MKKILIKLGLIISLTSNAQVLSVPIGGTYPKYPITNTLEYRGATASTFFVDTLHSFEFGYGNRKNLQIATIKSSILCGNGNFFINNNGTTGQSGIQMQPGLFIYSAAGNGTSNKDTSEVDFSVTGISIQGNDSLYFKGINLLNNGISTPDRMLAIINRNKDAYTYLPKQISDSLYLAITSNITINGVTKNLKTNPTFSISAGGTTSVTATSPLSVTSGTAIALNYGTGLSISSGSLINSSPNQTVTLTGAGTTTVTGTYPTFTINGGGGSGTVNTGTINQVAVYTGTTTVGGNNNLQFNGTNLSLGGITTGAYPGKFRINSMSAGQTISLYNPNPTQYGGIIFEEDAGNYGVLYRYNSTFSGNYSGTSVPLANGFQFQSGSGNDKTFAISATPVLMFSGGASTNIGTRHDVIGFRLDQLANIHTTNLNAFTVNGNSYLGGNSTATYALDVAGDIGIATVGKTLRIKTGTNSCKGTGTLSGGTATILTTAVVSINDVILTNTGGGTIANIGSMYVSSASAGTSFTVKSTNALDNSTFSFHIIKAY